MEVITDMKNRYAFINSFSFSLIFKLFVLGIASFSLYLHIDIDDLPNTFRFFGYFTVLSNLFCFIISYEMSFLYYIFVTILKARMQNDY